MTDTGSMLSHLECTYCGEVFSANKINKLCSYNDCGKVLFPRYEIDSSKGKKILSDLSDRKPNMWRYKEFMPVRDEKNIVTLGEGFTPILECERLSYELGANIILKDEGLNPTSSFKARGLSSAVSKAKELGVSKFSIPSAGNAGGALAAYCARAGLEAYVFMPKDAPLANKTETIFHGANIELIDGYINDAGARSLELSKKKNLFDVSTLKEPYRVEGKKTMGYEIAEQLNWVLPDNIVYPTGGGTGIIGIWKAFQELNEIGILNSDLPRMICVQAEGCSPVVDAYLDGNRHAELFKSPQTIAAGMRVPIAVGDYLIIDAVKESNGTAIKVSDNNMIDGVNQLSNLEGIFCAPEGGSIVSATKKLISSGFIKSKESVLLLNTGSGFKYLDGLSAQIEAN
ncbi:MAG: threonine synthase [Chloroflexota bacterium]|nr:threonine synthase [Chloroflexota bacterium]